MSADAAAQADAASRADGRAQFWIGGGLTAIGALFALIWYVSPSGPGEAGGIFLLPTFLVTPVGVGFMISGAAAWLHLPGRRALRWAPVLAFGLQVLLVVGC